MQSSDHLISSLVHAWQLSQSQHSVVVTLTATLPQSICTHYSCFENMGQFVTLKIIRSKIWVANSRVYLFSFWITMTLFFCTLIFTAHILDPFFQVHKLTHVFKTRIVGADWLAKWVCKCEYIILFAYLWVVGDRVPIIISCFSNWELGFEN